MEGRDHSADRLDCFLGGSAMTDQEIEAALTYDPEAVQKALDLDWLKETDDEVVIASCKLERKSLEKKYNWPGRMRDDPEHRNYASYKASLDDEPGSPEEYPEGYPL